MLTAAAECRAAWAAWAVWTCKNAPAFDVQRRCERRHLMNKGPGGKPPGLFVICPAAIRCVQFCHMSHTVTIRLTVDRTDFRSYRRNKREAIALICPPER